MRRKMRSTPPEVALNRVLAGLAQELAEASEDEIVASFHLLERMFHRLRGSAARPDVHEFESRHQRFHRAHHRLVSGLTDEPGKRRPRRAAAGRTLLRADLEADLAVEAERKPGQREEQSRRRLK